MNMRTDLPDQSPSHSPDWNSRMLTAAGFMGQSVKAVNMFASIRSYNLARRLSRGLLRCFYFLSESGLLCPPIATEVYSDQCACVFGKLKQRDVE